MSLAIHTTDRMSFKRCRQRWDFESPLRQNLEPNRPQEPLWFGTGIHHALAAYYEPSTPRDGATAIDAWTAWCTLEREKFEAREGNLWVEEEEHFGMMYALGVEMLKNYCYNYAPSVDDFEVLWVEREYKIPLFKRGDVEIPYSFRVDGLVKDKYGKLWILEHKTAESFNTNRRWLVNDDQVGSYIWGIYQTEGVFVEGVLYNTLMKAAQKPLRVLKNGTLSTDKRQRVTYAAAKKQLEEAGLLQTGGYEEFLQELAAKEEAEGNPFFKREPIRRNTHEIIKLGEDIIAESRDMVRENLPIYRTPGPFTCNFCPFFEPCVAKYEGGDVQFVLDTLYRKKEGYEPVKANG